MGLLISGCQGEARLQTDAQIASYALGMDVGRSFEPAAEHIDMAAFKRGIEDMMAGREPALADSVLQAALSRFATTVQAALAAEADELARKNLEEGQAYLAENARKAGVLTTPSGVQIEVLQEGTGPKPSGNDQVTLHYRGTLLDGTEFDSSGDEPVQFSVAPGGLIEGFREALQEMQVGGRYRIVIPSHLAYGEMGSGPIGPNSTLIFEVEPISIP